MKVCTRCGETKYLESYYRNKRNTDGRAFECKDCSKARDAERYKTPERRLSKKRVELRSLYNVEYEVVMQMYSDQGGLCKICNSFMEVSSESKDVRKTFCVDHNHTTGKIRGLLCSDCNRGIGFLKDSPSVLESAFKYLRESHGRDCVT